MIESAPGLINGRYDVAAVVGRGGEGTVLQAVDRRHDRVVALKRRRLPSDPEEAERILLEARTLLSLQPHPGLPLARDDFFEDGFHYIVLDWVDGVDLASFLTEHGTPGLPLATVLRWLAPVAQALTHLHSSQPPIVHGDVKPANLIVTRTGDIVLVDLGVSSTRGVEVRGGTPGFRAPEVVTDRMPTRAADVYGLAATAFALLTGAPPAGVLPQWGFADPERAARLESALRRGLATDPRRRTATPGEFVEELRAGWDTGGAATGVLTFLSSDVVISGRMWDEDPHAAIALRAEHLVLLDAHLELRHGRRIGDIPNADAVMAVFERAGDAVAAAIALQREAVAQSVPLRCALDTGEAVAAAGYAGATSTRVGRVRELAQPGQVIVTAVTARLAAGELEADVGTIELGSHRIAGFDDREQLLAIDAVGLAVPPDPNTSPYPGLSAFQSDDRDLFFGREDIVVDLVERLEDARLVGVVGASGSGKSSLLRAGLAPLLAGAVIITPTEHPLAVSASIPDDVVLVVDQLEELFTLCEDAEEATQFADLLVTRSGRCAVAIRADMYGLVVEHPMLAEAIAANHVLLGRMTHDQLRDAVARPAEARGFEVDAGLAEVVLADVADQPGVLPHLAHALRETWHRREGRTLTVAGYRAAGGVRGALTQTAEQLYDESDDDQRRVMRSALLRMVELGDGMQDSRRRVALADLRAGHDAADVRSVVERLAQARLVTIEAESVEPAHEALLRDWPRLREWIEDARTDLRLQRDIEAAAEEWSRLDRDEAHLFRGSRLVAATEWIDANPDEARPIEHEFVEAGREQAQSELAAAQRSARRLRTLLAGVAALLVLALVAGGFAVIQRNRAHREANGSDARGLAAQAIASAPTAIDTSLLLAVEGFDRERSVETEDGLATALNAARFMARNRLPVPVDVANLAVTPDGATLVALTFDGRLARFDTSTWGPLGSPIDLDVDRPNTIDVSHDGTMAAFGAADGIHVVRLADGSAVVPPIQGPAGIGGFFSADDQFVVASYEGSESVIVFDVASERVVAELPVGNKPLVDLRPGTDEMAVAPYEGQTITRFRMDGSPVGDPLELGDGTAVINLTYSTDGRLLAVGRTNGSVDLLDAETLQPVRPSFGVRGSRVYDLSFNNDSTRLVVGSDDGSARIYSIVDGGVEATVGGLDGAVAVEFVDGDRFVAVTPSQGVEYDLREATALGEARQEGDVTVDIVASPDGESAFVLERHRIVQLGADLRSRAADIATPDFLTLAMAIAPDGRSVAVQTAALDDTDLIEATPVNIVDLATGQSMLSFVPIGDEFALRMDYAPDGSALAIATEHGRLAIYDPATGDELLAPTVVDPLYAIALRWSQDGSTVFVGGQLGSLREIDPRSGIVLRELELTPSTAITDIDRIPQTTLLAVSSESGEVFVVDSTTMEQVGEPMTMGGSNLLALAVSDDGRTIAAVSRDGALRLWDRESRRPIVPALTAHGGGGANGVVFTSDGGLLSVGADGSIVSWDLDPQHWRTRACDLAGRNMTQDEWTQYVPNDAYAATCEQYALPDRVRAA